MPGAEGDSGGSGEGVDLRTVDFKSSAKDVVAGDALCVDACVVLITGGGGGGGGGAGPPVAFVDCPTIKGGAGGGGGTWPFSSFFPPPPLIELASKSGSNSLSTRG